MTAPDFALLFDLDGTLVDTEHLHLQAFGDIFREAGLEIDQAYFVARIAGRSNEAIMADAFPERSLAEHEAIADRKEALYRSLVERLEPAAGLIALLDWADRHGLPSAVVTNAPRANANHVLAALGIADRFRRVIAGGEVARAKPDPLPYLTALADLGGTVPNAMVFEDSLSGVRAGIAAGLPTFGMLTSLDAATLLGEGAVLALRDFCDERLWAWLERRTGKAR
jgi:HAD superfamily hydrolase (TIGR01509 family)